MMPTMKIVVLQAQLRHQAEKVAALELELAEKRNRLAVERSKLVEIAEELRRAREDGLLHRAREGERCGVRIGLN